jgi:thymidylate synthase
MYHPTADSLYKAMIADIASNDSTREATGTTPASGVMHEAVPGRQYNLLPVCNNLVTLRPIRRSWNVANILHFFSGSEEASFLPRYNPYAAKFLTNGRWIGAYGAIALPQIERCIRLLRQHKDTRRAVVSMGELGEQDMNRPACWTSLHFLVYQGALDMLVYQRSLNVTGVMPYDLCLLSNILQYAATAVGVPCGALRWTIGSSHAPTVPGIKGLENRAAGVTIPYGILSNPAYCLGILRDPSLARNEPFGPALLEVQP